MSEIQISTGFGIVFWIWTNKQTHKKFVVNGIFLTMEIGPNIGGQRYFSRLPRFKNRTILRPIKRSTLIWLTIAIINAF